MNTQMVLKKFLASLLIIFFAIIFAQSNLNAQTANPPQPILKFNGTENYEANGKKWIRFRLEVVNRAKFPNEMFAEAPDLPACGLNKNSSRTWIDVYAPSKRAYGFCALTSNRYLADLWYAVEQGARIPKYAYIVMRDRLNNKIYTSNKVEVVPQNGGRATRID